MCYIKCKQLRPRVDVEIVGGGDSGQASAGLPVSEPEPGWLHTVHGLAWARGQPGCVACIMYNVALANSHKPNVITDHTTCH